MKTKLTILAFLAAGSLLAPRFYAGVRFGYAPAPVAVVAAPPAPLVSYVPPSRGRAIAGSEATGIPWVRTCLACRILDPPRFRRRPLVRPALLWRRPLSPEIAYR